MANVEQETIENLYYHSLQLCEGAYPKNAYLAAREAIKLTDTLVELRDVDMALMNVNLNPKSFRASFGPERKIDFTEDRTEYLYAISAMHWLKVATKFTGEAK